QAAYIDRAEYAPDRVEHLVEVGGANVALQRRDVRLVVLVEREPARDALQHPGVDGLGARDHRLVGVDEDVDSGQVGHLAGTPSKTVFQSSLTLTIAQPRPLASP